MRWKRFFGRLAYSWAWRLITPFYLLKLWRRGRKEPEYWQHKGERFGLYSSQKPRYQGHYVWIHAVSLGEARASNYLIQELRKKIPDMKLLLTHGTATGRVQGKALLQEGDEQCWLPNDFPGAVRRFLLHYQPQIGLLVETEIWPNLVLMATKADIPVFLVNARLSEKSLRNATKASFLLRPVYEALSMVLAQSDDDARRLQTIGAKDIQILGNIKYDMLPNPDLVEQGVRWKTSIQRKVVMAASTREGEEQLLIEAWMQSLWMQLPIEQQPILLIVPRHPQRFSEVGSLIDASGAVNSQRSTWGDEGPSDSAPVQIWLGDSLREMPLYYSLADIVLVGGSFLPFGGQNLIEALSCKNPIIFGEHTYNFALASQQTLDEGIGVRVESFESGLTQVAVWLENEEELKRLKQKSVHFVQEHQGASERMAAVVAEYLQILRS